MGERTAELKQSLEELETFSSSLTHDLKAPLRAISGYAEALQEDHARNLSPEGQELARRVVQACSRMTRFVDNVLAYTRLRGGVILLERVKLRSLVPRIIEEFPWIKATNAELTIEQPLLAVQGNENLLIQIIANLVSNAVKFVAPGTRPKLKIWTERRNQRARLWFQDNGIGIAGADQPKVFGLFTRLHSTKEYEGTGVGLAVVQRAVWRMGGQVGVESERGKGSAFWIEMEAAEPNGNQEEVSYATRRG